MKDNLKNKMLASVLLGSIALGGCSGSGGGGSSSTNPTTPTPSNPVVTYSQNQVLEEIKKQNNLEDLGQTQNLTIGQNVYNLQMLNPISSNHKTTKFNQSGEQTNFFPNVSAKSADYLKQCDELTPKFDSYISNMKNTTNSNVIKNPNGTIDIVCIPYNNQTEKQLEEILDKSNIQGKTVISNDLKLFANGLNGKRRPKGKLSEVMPGTIEELNFYGESPSGEIFLENVSRIIQTDKISSQYFTTNNGKLQMNPWNGDWNKMFQVQNISNGIYSTHMKINGISTPIGSLDKDSNCPDGLYHPNPNNLSSCQ